MTRFTGFGFAAKLEQKRRVGKRENTFPADVNFLVKEQRTD